MCPFWAKGKSCWIWSSLCANHGKLSKGTVSTNHAKLCCLSTNCRFKTYVSIKPLCHFLGLGTLSCKFSAAGLPEAPNAEDIISCHVAPVPGFHDLWSDARMEEVIE